MNITAFVSSVDHKVYFQLFPYLLAIPIHGILHNHTDIYIVSSPDQIIIQYIFHQMGFFNLPKSKKGITQSRVRVIIFHRSTDIFPPFHIIAFDFLNQVRVHEKANVAIDGTGRYFNVSFRVKCV